ncbi:MAG: Protease 1 [uncultured Sulfurovum sp.]|uniref:Protease 1 n=1 Tax=uncultured Sulfurovum sp. TaxID=269237 RepID=A0A6S6SXA7_9BACT|nr:MAG: Protease 1 [uncultured Sulfurovum sp.]
MKVLFRVMLLLVVNVLIVSATVYENAEDGLNNRWSISDSSPEGAIISNVYDNTLKSNVIELKGQNYENQYTIGGYSATANAWNETKDYLSFSFQSREGFLIDVILETNSGLRYIRYSDDDRDKGLDDEYVNTGLGYDASNGEWQQFSRDLSADLKKFEPNNEIVFVHGLEVRGSCKFDNIEIKNKPSLKEFVVYEDAEDNNINRWKIVNNEPLVAEVTNVYDAVLDSQVIKLQGNGSYDNEYLLGESWSNHSNFNLQWDMRTVEGFIIDVHLKTDFGDRYLRYSDNSEAQQSIDGDTLSYGLGYFSTNGDWHTFSRNLEEDLRKLEGENKLLSVESFSIRANAKLDNIELFSSPNKIYEDAEDGKNDRWSIYLGPDSAKIINKLDNEKASKVISLEGEGYGNQYLIGGDLYNKDGWNDSKHTHIKWSMKNSDGYIIYVNVKTVKGNRFIKYDDSSVNNQSIEDEDLHYGLGGNSSDGTWHTYIRDISKDIKELESDNELLSIEGFLVIGNMQIDDLELFKILHPSNNEAGLVLTFDDHDVSGWYSMRNVFLEHGIRATFFVDQFHTLSDDEITKLKTLESDGHEIGCHTYDHKGIGRDYNNDVNLIDDYLNEQIIPAYENMKNRGFNPTSLAYPYGEHESSFDSAVRRYFPYLRTTASDNNRQLYQLNEIFHTKGKNYNILAGDGVDNDYGNELEEIEEALIKAKRNGEVITFYAHQIDDNPNNPYAISPKKLQTIAEYVNAMSLRSYSFKEGYTLDK